MSWFGPCIQKPEDVLKALDRPSHVSEAMSHFKAYSGFIRASLILAAAYYPVTSGLACLMRYACHDDPDPVVKKRATEQLQSRIDLRMQVLQLDIVS